MGVNRRRNVLLLSGAAAILVVLVVALVIYVAKNSGHALASTFSALFALASLAISCLAVLSNRIQAQAAQEQVVLAKEQAIHAGEQARVAALAATYAFQPILLPVHDAIRVLAHAGAEEHYPAVDPFQLSPPAPSDRVFLVDRATGRIVLFLRNVGRGPALDVIGELWTPLGGSARLEGNPAIGPDSEGRYSATLAKPTTTATPEPQTPVLATLWSEFCQDPRLRERVALLRVSYRTSAPAGSALSELSESLEAVFDPSGTGRWHSALTREKAPINDRGPGK